jgi:hypothetical protein
MPDAQSAAEEAGLQPTSSDLSLPVQITAAALGLSLVVAGVVAVFTTDNEIGSATLLLIGLALLIIAMINRFPSTFKAGQVEFNIPPRAVAVAAAAKVNASVKEAAGQEGATPGTIAAAAQEAVEAITLEPPLVLDPSGNVDWYYGMPAYTNRYGITVIRPGYGSGPGWWSRSGRSFEPPFPPPDEPASAPSTDEPAESPGESSGS